MGHYAFLDDNNTVVEVITGRDENDGEIDWEQYYSQIRGLPCKRTSYNTFGGKHNNGGTAFRKNYAGPGYTYDADLDAFIPPQPYTSWILDTETCLWQPPVARPDSDQYVMWDEATISWITVNT